MEPEEIMKCQFCGRDNVEGYVYCTYCGTVLAKPADLNKPEVKEIGQRLEGVVRERQRTDRILSPLWIVVPIILVLITSIIGFGMVFSALWDEISANPDYDPYELGYPEEAVDGMLVMYFGTLIYQLIIAVLTYLLVDRLNKHFDRERRLRQEVVSLIRTGTKTPELESLVSYEMNAIATTEQFGDQRRQPAFWAIVILLPAVVSSLWMAVLLSEPDAIPAGMVALNFLFSIFMFAVELYLLYFLGKSMYQHDVRWNDFSYSAQRALSKVGFPIGPSYRLGRLEDRSFLLYLVLTFVTLGLFIYYWWYTLIKDPNNHFERQWGFEDSVMESLKKV